MLPLLDSDTSDRLSSANSINVIISNLLEQNYSVCLGPAHLTLALAQLPVVYTEEQEFIQMIHRLFILVILYTV